MHKVNILLIYLLLITFQSLGSIKPNIRPATESTTRSISKNIERESEDLRIKGSAPAQTNQKPTISYAQRIAQKISDLYNALVIPDYLKSSTAFQETIKNIFIQAQATAPTDQQVEQNPQAQTQWIQNIKNSVHRVVQYFLQQNVSEKQPKPQADSIDFSIDQKSAEENPLFKDTKLYDTKSSSLTLQDTISKVANRPTQATLPLHEINARIFKISQPQVDQRGNGKIPTTGKVESSQDYIRSNKATLNHMKNNEIRKLQEQIEKLEQDIQNINTSPAKKAEFTQRKRAREEDLLALQFSDFTNKISSYDKVIDSRGDGNCGYRAFYVSTLLSGLKDSTVIDHLRSLVNTKFSDMFERYDKNFTDTEGKTEIGNQIKAYLEDTLTRIQSCTTIEKIQAILEAEPTFDYYMIMFERFLMLDHLAENPDLKLFMDNSEKTIQDISTWKTELDQAETTLLAQATNINIHTVLETTDNIQDIPAHEGNFQAAAGDAHILYVTGHYRILVPKSSSGESTKNTPEP